MRRIIFSLYVFLPLIGLGQIGNSYPYFLSSDNGAFFLKSIPFESQIYNLPGRTDVFRTSDSIILYSINRYFDPDGIILSNDGSSILFAQYTAYNYKGFDERMLSFYKNGVPVKSYNLDQLVKKDSDEYMYSIFYENWDAFDWENGNRIFNDTVPEYERILIEDPFFSNGDMAYLASKDKELIRFDLRDGSIIKRSPFVISKDTIILNYKKQNISKPDYNGPSFFSLPKLADGSEYQKMFGEKFNLQYDEEENPKFKYYRLEITCLIDHGGNCLEVYSNYEDSSMNHEIQNLFLALKFDSTEIPEIIERWYFYHISDFRKKDLKVAKKERQEEKEKERVHLLWRIEQDSLEGVYIPKNLEDCFSELDKMLSEHNKEGFKKGDPHDYHFGLGKNLRNSWGLWSGSRLSEYFNDLGIYHPDSMSGIILTSYHKYLLGQDIGLKGQIKECKKDSRRFRFYNFISYLNIFY